MTTTDHLDRTAEGSFLASAIDTFRDRRNARALYRTAERELSTYTTGADLQELEAMLERSDGDDAGVYGEIIERILSRLPARETAHIQDLVHR